jgi:hypothetical protein
MQYALRLTAAQHSDLMAHLFPGDGNEAVAILVCGRMNGTRRHVFTVRELVPVPYDLCSERTPDKVTWSTEAIERPLAEAFVHGYAIVKVHSHPGGSRGFSESDDVSDRAFLGSVSQYMGDGLPHASVVVLPSGEMCGRAVTKGVLQDGLSPILVVGDDLRIWSATAQLRHHSTSVRQIQAFGRGTISLLQSLSVAVVGCSGTGSVVVEQLARLGVGRLVLVDPDVVQEKNLNRILNSGKEDAYLARPKVEVLAKAIARMGFGQEVTPIQSNILSRDAVRAVAECDIVFGCMDGAEGRHCLNRLSVFYTMPYIDVGVRLDADGAGGIRAISGAVHFLQPGRSSLLSRGVYDMERVVAEGLKRTNPALYAEQLAEGYLRGVDEDRPAVIPVNSFFASLAVQELLARLHPFRYQPNSRYAYLGGSLCDLSFFPEEEGENCAALARHVGRGDVEPLLENPELS